MVSRKLKLAILWHQHQPYYKSEKNLFQMPWVRFHGTKDYLDMALIIKEFPDIKQNINLVPSLLLQLEDYIKNGVKDNIWLLTEIPAEELTYEDKKAILENFFLANPATMIRPYPRYFELFLKFKEDARYLSEGEQVKLFSAQDFRDLQVWYNLTWFGMVSRERPAIKNFFQKGRNFTEDDKKLLLEETLKVLGEIVPVHKSLWEQGQVELSTTPFYHPILPLLIDSTVAKISDPSINLPPEPFRHPEDAEAQVQKALDYFEALFGQKPLGMWPAEGSVSEDAAELFARFGIQWIATDEGILARSLKEGFQHTRIYQPYQFVGRHHAIHIFFRDHYLSDAIGFVYSNWEEDKAVADFMNRLYSIRERIVRQEGEEALWRYLVPVILDGENCWEYYQNDGRSFMRKLYSRLSEDPYIETATFGEFLQGQKDVPRLNQLHPGSWINSNFNIWIGAEEDNRAWTLLKRTRDFLVSQIEAGFHSEEAIQAAWEKIYIAEGSDWNWWYGDEHSSSHDMEFDQLFREHLMGVYELLGQEPPADLYQTIKHSHFDRFTTIRPVNFIYPVIDGRSTHFYEWTGAAVYDGSKLPQTAMHQVTRIIDKLFIGFNAEDLFLRIDFLEKPDIMYEYVLSVKIPHQITIIVSPLRGVIEKYVMKDGGYEKQILEPRLQLDKVLEVAIPFSALDVHPGEKLGFQIHIKMNNQVVEIFPHINLLEVEVPDENFEMIEWSA